MILDSNIVIHATLSQYVGLRHFIATLPSPAVSAITLVETLGYHKLLNQQRVLLEATFAAADILPVDEAVIARAVTLRQVRKMKLGDALIAATALVAGWELMTRNVRDFAGIPGLAVIEPPEPGDSV